MEAELVVCDSEGPVKGTYNSNWAESICFGCRMICKNWQQKDSKLSEVLYFNFYVK